jgi:hypothetical protein
MELGAAERGWLTAQLTVGNTQSVLCAVAGLRIATFWTFALLM